MIAIDGTDTGNKSKMDERDTYDAELEKKRVEILADVQAVRDYIANNTDCDYSYTKTDPDTNADTLIIRSCDLDYTVTQESLKLYDYWLEEVPKVNFASRKQRYDLMVSMEKELEDLLYQTKSYVETKREMNRLPEIQREESLDELPSIDITKRIKEALKEAGGN